MQTEKAIDQARQDPDQDQEIADLLGISVLSPLEETAVSGGQVEEPGHHDHDHTA